MKHHNIEAFAYSGHLGGADTFEGPISIGRPSWMFAAFKRVTDLTMCVVLLPVLVFLSIILVVLNPFYNRGGLFYVQERMGRGTSVFSAIKFRTMTAAVSVERGAHEPLETHRITPLGQFLRKSRLDEIPQIINVFRSEMSLIGPRPDYYGHALEYLDSVPGYRARHAVKPGISGFAQTEVGYADTPDAVAAKVAADLYYIRHRRTRLEAWIFWRTLVIVFGRKGA